MRSATYLGCALLCAISLLACTTTTTEAAPGSGAAAAQPAGVDELGKDCVAACGSGDDRKCTMPSGTCTSNLCIVDPTQPGTAHIAYCTVDCTSADAACPAGWHCEDVKAFENDAVSRACVADPMNCGDGVVELGEVCDGDDAEKGKCVDCKKYVAVCGDKHVQPPEACDGDSDKGYCSPDCKTLEKPSLALTSVDVQAWLAGDAAALAGYSGSPVLDYPSAGDAKGCNKLEILSTTAAAARVAWTLCDATTGSRSTLTFALPKNAVDVTSGKDIPPELMGSYRIVDPKTGRDVTFGPMELSYELSSSGDANVSAGAVGSVAPHQSFGDVYFRFRVYRPASGKYDVASFRFYYEWTVPPS